MGNNIEIALRKELNEIRELLGGNPMESTLEQVSKLKASQFKPKWISVEDELPNNTNLCLVFKLPGIEIARYYKEDNSWIKFRNGKFIEYIGITHWMPLPEKP